MTGGFRAELAGAYLQSGIRSLYEVAELLGFSAASAFSRWFQRHFGVSPSAWRKQGALRRETGPDVN